LSCFTCIGVCAQLSRPAFSLLAMASSFSGEYDKDCITFSPQGALHQLEYAMKAVEQGAAVVGMKSKTHVVLCCFMRRMHDNNLASYQQKIWKIDDHLSIAISGLTADGRVLADFMRTECVNHQYVYDTPMHVGRLVGQVQDKAQAKTQSASKRPYGVGMLVAGYDAAGPHLFETCPSGNYWEYYAQAIGGRSHAARTYMEKKFKAGGFEDLDKDSLIQSAIEALNRTTTATETSLSTQNMSVAIMGADEKYHLLNEEDLKKYIDKLEKKEEEPDAAMADAAGGAAPMDTSGS